VQVGRARDWPIVAVAGHSSAQGRPRDLRQVDQIDRGLNVAIYRRNVLDRQHSADGDGKVGRKGNGQDARRRIIVGAVIGEQDWHAVECDTLDRGGVLRSPKGNVSVKATSKAVLVVRLAAFVMLTV